MPYAPWREQRKEGEQILRVNPRVVANRVMEMAELGIPNGFQPIWRGL